VREAMGFAAPSPDDRVRQDELGVLPLLEFQLRNGFRPTIVERALRVSGDSMRRVAETEADWFRSEILQPLLDKGWTGAQISRNVARFAQLGELSDKALLALFHGQQANAWIKNILEGFEQALTAIGHPPRIDHPPAVCFLDLSGYTRLTDERGDEAAANLAEKLNAIVRRSSVEHGGRPVKWLGDGVMMLFRDPGPGVLGALEMVARGEQAGLPPAHVGLHCGPVLFQEGDYFGRTVNVASRIADYARAGQVLVSQDVVDATAAAGVDGITFSDVGPVRLKGLSDPVRLQSAALAH
jgi:adenylate cyclase